MAVRLGRVIYWFMSGLAVLALAAGALGAVIKWPGRTPPNPTELAIASVATEVTADNRRHYTFTFPSGAQYRIKGPDAVLNLETAREKLRTGLIDERRTRRERLRFMELILGGAVGAAVCLFLLGRAARYILANE